MIMYQLTFRPRTVCIFRCIISLSMGARLPAAIDGVRAETPYQHNRSRTSAIGQLREYFLRTTCDWRATCAAYRLGLGSGLAGQLKNFSALDHGIGELLARHVQREYRIQDTGAIGDKRYGGYRVTAVTPGEEKEKRGLVIVE